VLDKFNELLETQTEAVTNIVVIYATTLFYCEVKKTVMNEEKTNKPPVTIEADNTVKASSNESAKSGSQKSSASTQMQLLNIAKSFCLADALKPVDKQAPIEERMVKRERFNHLRKQANLETIIEKSLKYCSEHEAANRADPDWFSNFVELAENISNTTMQDLWAKILAGEVSHPGSFSIKALQAFKSLTIVDAKLLAKACSVAVKDKSKKHIRLLSGSYQKPGLFNFFDKQRVIDIPLSQFGLGYGEILALSDNHLIFAQEAELPPIAKGEEIAFKQGGNPLILKAKKKDVVLKFYKFTSVGAELAQLIVDKPDEEFNNLLKTKLSYHFDS
jgi:uncharacterized repeat protein (TIGR03899 family)